MMMRNTFFIVHLYKGRLRCVESMLKTIRFFSFILAVNNVSL